MQVFLEVERDQFRTRGAVTARIFVLNDSYEPVILDRRLLVGPNPAPERLAGAPFPVSLEPALPREEQNLIVLNPWCFYGRQRTFDGLPPGRVMIHGYLLRKATHSLLPERPVEPDAIHLPAAPLRVVIE